jgi:hypothetical protein
MINTTEYDFQQNLLQIKEFDGLLTVKLLTGLNQQKHDILRDLDRGGNINFDQKSDHIMEVMVERSK